MSSDNYLGKRYGKRMFIAAWLAVLALLYVFFNDTLQRQHNPNQLPNTQMMDDVVAQVTLERNRYGHYVSSGRINGQAVTFMLDTGATMVSVPVGIARRIGLRKGAARKVRTANGTATVYATELDSIELGGIQLNHLKGHINPNMQGDILLGMTFLKHLKFTQDGKRLILEGPASLNSHPE